MRHDMTGFSNRNYNRGSTRVRLTLCGTLALLAVACPLGLSAAEPKAPPAANVKPTGQAQVIRSTVQSGAVMIPECLEKLKLSDEQQNQIQAIIRDYDESLGIVWKQFGDRYLQTISMETAMLAAIEDHLTEAQRMQVRAQRHKTAKYERAMAATNTKVNQAADKPNEQATAGTNAADEGLAAINVTLTDEQEASAEKVQEKYRNQLRSLNRDIQGLHTRLLSLEADKLVEIEKILTKDQLAQLRISRQNGPDAPKVAVRRTDRTTTE